MANFTEITANELSIKLNNLNGAKLIDCRTAPELLEYKLKFDYHIDVLKPDFANQLSDLDKSATYYIYCRSGSRSAFLCNYMYDLGFRNLYNLAGGVLAWREAIK